MCVLSFHWAPQLPLARYRPETSKSQEIKENGTMVTYCKLTLIFFFGVPTSCTAEAPSYNTYLMILYCAVQTIAENPTESYLGRPFTTIDCCLTKLCSVRLNMFIVPAPVHC